MSAKIIERVALSYEDAATNSDKVYEIELTEVEGGYKVTGYNGRRGTQLVAQVKTPDPVSLRAARQIFNEVEFKKINHRKTPYSVESRKRIVDESTPPMTIKQAVSEGTPTISTPEPIEILRKDESAYQPSFINNIEL